MGNEVGTGKGLDWKTLGMLNKGAVSIQTRFKAPRLGEGAVEGHVATGQQSLDGASREHC